MKIMDIHSHTYYSGCGRDKPEVIIEAALSGGIELFGISDHNYGIGTRKKAYCEEIRSFIEPYKDRIHLLCGIEISTLTWNFDMHKEDYGLFDYCLLENAMIGGDQKTEDSLLASDFFGFLDTIPIRKGIAHTDLFALAKLRGETPEEFFAKMAEHGVFWEMNVNYDSIHRYHEHEYVAQFFSDEERQKIIRDSGVYISIGFDGHRVEDYLPERIIDYNRRLEKLGVNTVDRLFE